MDDNFSKIICKKPLRVYSSYSEDRILDDRNKIIAIRKGGPAFFIGNILDKHKCAYILKIGSAAVVEIKVKKDEETGRVKNKIRTNEVPLRNSRNAVIISTIGREWIIRSDKRTNALIFLDIQGYVRDLHHFGRRKYFKAKFLDNIFCLKGNQEEIRYLPKEVVDKQKRKCLVVTKRRKGSIIYYKGKKFVFVPKLTVKAENTIGAGDTFFACFVLNFLRTKGNIQESGEFATVETIQFLKSKKRERNAA